MKVIRKELDSKGRSVIVIEKEENQYYFFGLRKRKIKVLYKYLAIDNYVESFYKCAHEFIKTHSGWGFL